MRILFIADGRSPIALNWIRYFIQRGDEVHLASLYPCSGEPGLRSHTILPVAFTRAAELSGSAGKAGVLKQLLPSGLRTRLKHWLTPRSLQAAEPGLRRLLGEIQPELVHAMRIPYEGMLAALATPVDIPLLVSVWGNDFTLHAQSSPALKRLTLRTLQRADALHTDCQRDLRLARDWGFAVNKPAVVLPGSGGIQLDLFFPDSWETQQTQPLTVINPRGLRAYARTDTFFRAVPLVLAERPETRFLCPAMAGEAEALRWMRQTNASGAITLLPRLERDAMADVFRRAQIALSITTHDGTPNTLLEAMACGCFPVAGDIETLREWITPGENGLLVDPGDPQALARAILQAAGDETLRQRARRQNLNLVRERAEYSRVMQAAVDFYRQILPAGS
jgi:hypothetical protein